jgi:hypothetical protein
MKQLQLKQEKDMLNMIDGSKAVPKGADKML